MKKPIHPQQYQYQYTTENARLMMSNELMKMEGLWNGSSSLYNIEPAPLSAITSVNGLQEVDMEDTASNASSDDSEFLERINELPLSSFGGATSMMLDDEEDDIHAENVRSEELIQLLDFATAL